MNFQRVYKPLKSNSFFLYGARGVGKTTFPSDEDVKHLQLLRAEFGEHEAYCFSNAPTPRLKDGSRYVHWRQGIKEIGLV